MEELSLASHLNVPAILVPLSSGNCVNLARCLMTHYVKSNSVVMTTLVVVSKRAQEYANYSPSSSGFMYQ